MVKPERKARAVVLALTLAAAGGAEWSAGADSPAPADAERGLAPCFADRMVLQRGRPLPFFGYATPGADVSVAFAGVEGRTTAGADGAWRVTLDAQPAGGPHGLTVTAGDSPPVEVADVLVGDVWVCAGQSNMQFALANAAGGRPAAGKADHPWLRFARAPRRVAAEPGDAARPPAPAWHAVAPDNAASLSAVAYYFGARLQRELDDVPVGLLVTTWPGTFIEGWMPDAALDATPDGPAIRARWTWLAEHHAALTRQFARADKAWSAKHLARFKRWEETRRTGPFVPPRPFGPPDPEGPLAPARIYNAMVHPFTGLPVRGVVWYQGESNTDRAYQYRRLLPAMIEGWRAAWGIADLPFVVVQLPEYEPDLNPYDRQDGGPWEVLRESQAVAVRATPNAALVVTLGLGRRGDVHPPDKRGAGERCAAAALRLAYGREEGGYAPVGHSEGPTAGLGAAIIRFDHAESGLSTLDGRDPVGFRVVDGDGRVHDAKAKMAGAGVLVPLPAAGMAEIRYAWEGAPATNLVNAEGLPVGPFRTDNLPVPTQDAVVPYGWLSLP